MQIFSGSSNQDLAQKIVKAGEFGLGIVESTTFENGERRVRVGDGGKHQGNSKAVLVQSLSVPVDEHLIEFCLLSDALSRDGYTNLVGVVPWLGYSKQDKVFLPGESLAAKVIAQLIQTTKIKKLITFDLHNRAITGFFDIPVVELSAKPIFLEYFRKMVGENTIVVAPDEGAVKSSAYFARELSVPIAYMDKRRDLKTGKVEVVGMSGEVSGKAVIIVDDMIVTGSTMMETAKYLKSKGAKSVSVAATHHLYVEGTQAKLDQSEIDEVVVSDTVECPKEIKSKKLKILSVAGLIVDELN
ncbi:ribose-phosphate pyrophosphokinase [Candidatus Woesebacteria bacterium]|nr:ribose-phosphate pyrophosphokinase [Candidatus Woesebacteria bacterium]